MSCITATTYKETFPTHLAQKASQGFIASTTLRLFLGTATDAALLGGAMAVTATIIEAITRPIIKAIFPENPVIGLWIQIIVPSTLVMSAALALAPTIGIVYKTASVIFSTLTWICLNSDFYEKNTAMVTVF